MASKPVDPEDFKAAVHVEQRVEEISYNVNAR